jgi:hypothetical protein
LAGPENQLNQLLACHEFYNLPIISGILACFYSNGGYKAKPLELDSLH